MSKFTVLAAAAAGYVLGARAGRQRYEQIAAGARKVARNPRVQAAGTQARDAVAAQASVVTGAAAEKAKDAASTVASNVADKVRRGDGGGAHAAEPTWPGDAAAPQR